MAAETGIDTDDDLPGDGPAPQPAPKGGKAVAQPRREPDPEPAPKKHTHSSKLTRLALDLGYTQDDLDNYPSDAIWEDIHNAAAAKPAAPEPKKPEAKPEPPADPDEAYLAELAATHPDLVRVVRRALKGADLKPLEEKLAKIDKLEQLETQRQAARFDRTVDRGFAALPDGYLDVFGDGTFADLEPLQQAARVAVFKVAKIDPARDDAKAVAAKIAAAAKAVAGDRVKEPAPSTYQQAAAKKQPQAKDPATGRFTAEDFANGHLQRPSGKQTGADPLDDVEQARRYFRERGDPRGDRHVAELDDDDLPG